MHIIISTPEMLGKIIRHTRQAQGLRQDDLALSLQTSHVALRQLEHGNVRQITRLFDVLSELGIRLILDTPYSDDAQPQLDFDGPDDQ